MDLGRNSRFLRIVPVATAEPPTPVPAPIMVTAPPATITKVLATSVPEPSSASTEIPEPTSTAIPTAEPTPVPEVIVDESGGINFSGIVGIVVVVPIIIGGAGFVLTRRKDS